MQISVNKLGKMQQLSAKIKFRKKFNIVLNGILVTTLASIISFSPQALADLSACTLTVSKIDFGNFNPYNTTPDQTTGTVSVSCTNTSLLIPVVLSYTVTFSSGKSTNMNSRMIYSGVNTIAYNIYQDSGDTQILGNGTGSTYSFSKSYFMLGGASIHDNFPIYGKIPVQALAIPGTYTDNITVTLTTSETL